jgi:hypothetical protein
MIAPQTPPLPVFIPAQAVAGADVPSQRLAPVAAIETSHIVPMDGSSHRDSRSENLLWLRRLSKLTDRPMNRGNQIGKLIRPEPMMPHVASDDFHR